MASCSGIRPDNLLELRKRNWRERPRRPSSGGMGPERELEERSRRRREEREPKEGGMGPEMLVEERLRSWREEREESCEGREERLRNVFGIESEITLFCGEQVIPCHEQGVEEFDGFQEERIGDLELGSEDERRERRVWPSGEREVTSTGVSTVVKINTTTHNGNRLE